MDSKEQWIARKAAEQRAKETAEAAQKAEEERRPREEEEAARKGEEEERLAKEAAEAAQKAEEEPLARKKEEAARKVEEERLTKEADEAERKDATRACVALYPGSHSVWTYLLRFQHYGNLMLAPRITVTVGLRRCFSR